MTPRIVEHGSRQHLLLKGAGVVICLAVVLGIPLALPDYNVNQFAQVAAYAVALLGLNVVSGMSGQISLGHAAFFGIGAFTTAILIADHKWSWFATLPISALLGLAAGLLIGFPALRLRGLYLAIVTLAFGTALPVFLSQSASKWLGAGTPLGKQIKIAWTKPAWFGLDVSAVGFKFIVVIVLAAVLFGLTALIVRSRVGRSMFAIADNETAATVSGVWPAGIKVGSFALSSVLAALGGSLYMLIVPLVSPASIGFMLTLLFLTAMIIGGGSTVSGAIIGAIFMVFMPAFTAQIIRDVPGLNTLTQPGLAASVLYGLILLAFVFLLPRGVAPALASLSRKFIRVIPAGVRAKDVVGPPPAAAPAPSPATDPTTSITVEPAGAAPDGSPLKEMTS